MCKLKHSEYEAGWTTEPLGKFWRKFLGPVLNQTTISGNKWSEQSLLNTELIEKGK
jgi:hypothetical protein